MATTMKICEKHISKADAVDSAKRLSENNPNNELYVIQSGQDFYVDDSCFIRSWETLLDTWLNGKKVKN
jgi:hypothetical protein